MLKVEPEGLTLLAEQAMTDIAHLLRPGTHNAIFIFLCNHFFAIHLFIFDHSPLAPFVNSPWVHLPPCPLQGHLKQLAKILDDPEASDNDRFVALELLKNVRH